MAEDVLDDEALEGSAAKVEAKTKAGPKPGAPHMLLRIVLGTAGLLLVVGFFLDWITIPSQSLSGLELVTNEDRDIREAVGETRRWILLAIPALGVALTAIGFLGLRWSAAVAAGIGLVLIVYGIVTVVALFIETTEVGLWLILAASFLALGSGLVTLIRGRMAKHPARDVTLRESASE